MIAAAGIVAGFVNAIAGGGPILTIAALLLFGVDARSANLMSTVGLFPGQIVAAWHGRAGLSRLGSGRARRAVVATCLAGGAIGAITLLMTPSTVFVVLIPWLILFATIAYALSGWTRMEADRSIISAGGAILLVPLAALSVYGGFYGGGNSFMVLALLAWRGVPPLAAGQAKNLLIAMINAAAVVVFLLSGDVDPGVTLPLTAGGLVGSVLGVALLGRIRPDYLRILVVMCGFAVSAWLFAAR